MLLPFLAVAAAIGVDRAALLLRARLRHDRLGGSSPLVFGLGIALLAASTDTTTIAQDIAARNASADWLQGFPDRSADDLILSYSTTVTTYYLGRTDFWLRPRLYEKYV